MRGIFEVLPDTVSELWPRQHLVCAANPPVRTAVAHGQAHYRQRHSSVSPPRNGWKGLGIRKLHKSTKTAQKQRDPGNDMVTLSGVPPGMAPLFDPRVTITLKQICEASTV
jgi:hypothetical protein